MSRRRRQVQPGHGRLRPAESRNGTEHQLLMDPGRPPIDRTADQVAVMPFETGGPHDMAGADARSKTGRMLLYPLLDPVRQGVELTRIPDALDRPVACVAVHP